METDLSKDQDVIPELQLQLEHFNCEWFQMYNYKLISLDNV